MGMRFLGRGCYCFWLVLVSRLFLDICFLMILLIYLLMGVREVLHGGLFKGVLRVF